MRKAGVLMPVSALPSRIGAGQLKIRKNWRLLQQNILMYWCRRTWRICIPIYRVIKGESCKNMADTATESGWLW